MSEYFVWRFYEDEPYKCYGTRNHVMPQPDDMRCVWRGQSFADGKAFARVMNQRRDGSMDFASLNCSPPVFDGVNFGVVRVFGADAEKDSAK